MADTSDDELGKVGDNGNTTHRITQAAPARRATNAGPSSKPVNGRGKTNARSPPQPTEDANEAPIADSESSLEYVDLDPPPAPAAAKKPVSKTQTAKGKAAPAAKKTRTDPPAKKTRANAPDEVVNVDELELADKTEHDPSPTSQLSRAVKGKQTATVPRRKAEDALREELARVKEELKAVSQHRKTLVDQLEEVFLGNSEAEELMAQQALQYEARLRTQEEMIQELTSQLARVDSLTRAGKTSTLHFLTREAAEEERRGVMNEVQRLKDALNEKDDVIAQRDQEIKEKEDAVRTLRLDLKAEIENTKAITSRNATRDPPSSATRGRRIIGPTKPDDSKNGMVVRLYEDLTNFLVINVKTENTADWGEVTSYSCVFTHAKSSRGVNFTLEDCYDRDLNKVMYTPLHLDREPPDFVEDLGFLGEPFTFERGQLNVFLKTMNDKLDELVDDQDE